MYRANFGGLFAMLTAKGFDQRAIRHTTLCLPAIEKSIRQPAIPTLKDAL
jgi:hypothetical protein